MSTLQVDSVSKSFGGVCAVDDVSVELEPGRITALIGPNGAGKTTLFNLIAGLLDPDAGEVLLDGERLNGLSPWRIAQRGIGRLFQDVHVFEQMTVRDNILAAFRDQPGESLWRLFLAWWTVAERERRITREADELIEFVGFEDLADDPCEKLSYGQQKLAALARLLAMESDILLLDEPTAGVNVRMVDELSELVRKLADEGKTIILIEHDIDVVRDLADTIHYMEDGSIAWSGTPDSVLARPEVRDGYLGLAEGRAA